MPSTFQLVLLGSTPFQVVAELFCDSSPTNTVLGTWNDFPCLTLSIPEIVYGDCLLCYSSIVLCQSHSSSSPPPPATNACLYHTHIIDVPLWRWFVPLFFRRINWGEGWGAIFKAAKYKLYSKWSFNKYVRKKDVSSLNSSIFLSLKTYKWQDKKSKWILLYFRFLFHRNNAEL